MFKKISTPALLIVLALLAGIVLFKKFYQEKKDESTFRAQFVKIDTAAVSSILIYPKAESGKEVKLFKKGSSWELQNDRIKTIADSNTVRSVLAMFTDLKAVSLAGLDKTSWDELQTGDTSGTRIKITTNDNQVYDMVVGKFAFNPGSRNGLSYIRHYGEEEVYAVDGFLSFGVNQGFDAWRNKVFMRGDQNDFTTFTFSYPGDSSFQLSKLNNEWLVNGEKADSLKTNQFLAMVSNMQAGGFADNYKPATTPVFTLNILGNNLDPVIIVAYQADTVQKYILHSSLNPDAYFTDSPGSLAGRLFVSRNHFAASPVVAD